MSQAEIKHRIGIKASPDQVFNALIDAAAISKWWTKAEGVSAVGKTIGVDFRGFIQPLKVTRMAPSKLVSLQPAEEGVPAWVNTSIEFRLARDEKNDQTLLYFTHAGYTASDDFFSKCSTNWAVYLISLKELVETGKGRPFPNNIECDHDS